ncbi:MAG: hypothetical protein LBH04_11880 [Tannerellaceae bacterium]|jgi:hypothetical protein|nr:hypothetical protein [Tannerellaceae bacterium]
MNTKYLITAFLLLLATIAAAQRPNIPKIAVYVSVGDALGLTEKHTVPNVASSKQDMQSQVLHIKGLYQLNTAFAFGLGAGYEVPGSSSYAILPIYASAHYHPIQKHKNFFLYSDLGYGIKLNISYPGLHYEIGVGYQLMVLRHFGFVFNAGYNLKQLRNQYDDYIDRNYNTSRHSLTLSAGILF